MRGSSAMGTVVRTRGAKIQPTLSGSWSSEPVAALVASQQSRLRHSGRDRRRRGNRCPARTRTFAPSTTTVTEGPVIAWRGVRLWRGRGRRAVHRSRCRQPRGDRGQRLLLFARLRDQRGDDRRPERLLHDLQPGGIAEDPHL